MLSGSGQRTRPAEPRDAPAIAAVYNEGIEDRLATFETEPRGADEVERWLEAGFPLVVVEDERGDVVAWASAPPYRNRAAYAGVGEFSVYVGRAHRRRGLGRAAIEALVAECERRGYWKLVSRVFPENAASLALSRACGFRDVGVYRRHGKLDGTWRDCVIVERLIGEAARDRPRARPGDTMRGVAYEFRDVAPGLWLWRSEHPEWQPGLEWQPMVASTCVESRGEIALLDPLAPPDDAAEIWARLDARPPTLVVVLKPDHVRDVDLFARRYDARAFGPEVFHRGNVPETELETILPGSELPGGLVALHDGRGRNETPLWLPEQRALVFADGLTAPEGELRIWSTPWHEERVLPALKALLELPFQRVIVSHGEPVHDRDAYERALELSPWSG